MGDVCWGRRGGKILFAIVQDANKDVSNQSPFLGIYDKHFCFYIPNSMLTFTRMVMGIRKYFNVRALKTVLELHNLRSFFYQLCGIFHFKFFYEMFSMRYRCMIANE